MRGRPHSRQRRHPGGENRYRRYRPFGGRSRTRSGSVGAGPRAATSRPARRSWTARASSRTGPEARSGRLRANASRDASATRWWTRSGCCSGWPCPPPVARNARAGRRGWLGSPAGSRGGAASGATGGYTGEDFRGWVREPGPRLEVEVVQRSDEVRGGGVLPRRRVVERTLGGWRRPRRWVRDDARPESRAEAWIHLAMIRLQLRRRA